jgi:hypothetical protein
MTLEYEIRSGRRVLSRSSGSTPQEVLVDYLRSQGCSDDEMVRLGVDAVSWHGAVYTAVESAASALTRRAA